MRGTVHKHFIFNIQRFNKALNIDIDEELKITAEATFRKNLTVLYKLSNKVYLFGLNY